LQGWHVCRHVLLAIDAQLGVSNGMVFTTPACFTGN
jgi:hypothetical protein